MEHKQFRKTLSERLKRPVSDIDALVDGLASVIRESCAGMDTVAVPSFGNFTPVKHDEEIVSDLSTGKRMLLPPEITLEYTPSARLSHRLCPDEPLL